MKENFQRSVIGIVGHINIDLKNLKRLTIIIRLKLIEFSILTKEVNLAKSHTVKML